MSEPIIFIAHNRVKEGKLDGLVEFLRAGYKRLEAEKPQTLASLAYLTNGSQVTVFHVFADAGSYDLHQQGMEERLRGADEFIESGALEIYGKPSDPALEMMRQGATLAGVTLSVQPDYLGGFLRLKSG